MPHCSAAVPYFVIPSHVLPSPSKCNIFSREGFVLSKLLPLSRVHMQSPHHFERRHSTAAFAVRQRVATISCSAPLCTMLISSLIILQPSIKWGLLTIVTYSSRSILSFPMTMPPRHSTLPTPQGAPLTAVQPLHARLKNFSNTLRPIQFLLGEELQRPLLTKAGEF